MQLRPGAPKLDVLQNKRDQESRVKGLGVEGLGPFLIVHTFPRFGEARGSDLVFIPFDRFFIDSQRIYIRLDLSKNIRQSHHVHVLQVAGRLCGIFTENSSCFCLRLKAPTLNNFERRSIAHEGLMPRMPCHPLRTLVKGSNSVGRALCGCSRPWYLLIRLLSPQAVYQSKQMVHISLKATATMAKDDK